MFDINVIAAIFLVFVSAAGPVIVKLLKD